MAIVFIVVSYLVEIILVELADKAGEVAVFEMFGENRLGKSLVLHRAFS